MLALAENIPANDLRSLESLLAVVENAADTLNAVVAYRNEIHQAFDSHPNNAAASNLMGALNFALGQNDEALLHFGQSCTLDDFGSPGYISNFVMAWLETAQDIENVPQNIDVYEAIVSAFMEANDFVKAHSILMNATTKWTLHIKFWDLLSKVHIQTDIDSVVWEDNREIFGLALASAVFPSSPSLQYLTAVQNFRRGLFRCAMEGFRRAVSTSLKEKLDFDLPKRARSYILRIEELIGVAKGDKSTEWKERELPRGPMSTFNQAPEGNARDTEDDCGRPHAFSPLTIHNSVSPCTNVTVVNDQLWKYCSSRLEVEVECGRGDKLCVHIGCSQWDKCARPGWIIVDAVEAISTHVVSTADDLSALADASAALIYSSHTLEHLSHSAGHDGRGEVCAALAEWNRVLVPGGSLLLSVPDLETLSGMMLDKRRTTVQKKLIMTVLYGGQDAPHNFHKTGFFFGYLRDLLEASGFCGVERVERFGLFDDTSELKLFGQLISLSVRAHSCLEGEGRGGGGGGGGARKVCQGGFPPDWEP